ncbi:hypothetical protein EJB05_40502, partial [Eragrostis curvula]
MDSNDSRRKRKLKRIPASRFHPLSRLLLFYGPFFYNSKCAPVQSGKSRRKRKREGEEASRTSATPRCDDLRGPSPHAAASRTSTTPRRRSSPHTAASRTSAAPLRDDLRGSSPHAAASRTSATPRRRSSPHAPVAFLCDDVLTNVLLRLPSLATLARAALVCKRWHRLATSADFLPRFRALHRSPLLLGCFVSAGLPYFGGIFYRAHVSDRDLAVAVRGGVRESSLEAAAGVKRLRWRIMDCRDGVLLLATRDQFILFNPVSRRRINLRRPPSCPRSNMRSYHCCLLPPSPRGVSSFRVVLLEEAFSDLVRAHVYSCGTGEWSSHQPWAQRIGVQLACEASMHADGRIYWKYIKAGSGMLCLDTGSMEFSNVALPPVPDLPWLDAARYVVGDTEDGACCLLCVTRLAQHDNAAYALQVWIRNKEAASWELHKQVHGFLHLMMTAGGSIRLYHVLQVCAVTAGIVLLKSLGVSGRSRYVTFSLKSLIAGLGCSSASKLPLKADFFTSRSWKALAYPYIMAWPPS